VIQRIAKAACMLAAAWLGSAAPAYAQALSIKEKLVLGSFNMCWEGEEQGNLATRLKENGFRLAPNSETLYMRQEQNTTILFTAFYGKDPEGGPETMCRITALKPQIVSPWTPKSPIFDDFSGLLERIVDGAATMGSGYRTTAMREIEPGSRDLRRTKLYLDERVRGRLIHIEEASTYYEFVYINSLRSRIASPTTLSEIIRPDARAAMQLMVDDSWEVAFCRLNPQNCLTEEQRRQQAEMAARASQRREPIPIPFSGIGAIRSGDNRSNEQRQRDRAFWDNFHRCGSGRC